MLQIMKSSAKHNLIYSAYDYEKYPKGTALREHQIIWIHIILGISLNKLALQHTLKFISGLCSEWIMCRIYFQILFWNSNHFRQIALKLVFEYFQVIYNDHIYVANFNGHNWLSNSSRTWSKKSSNLFINPKSRVQEFFDKISKCEKCSHFAGIHKAEHNVGSALNASGSIATILWLIYSNNVECCCVCRLLTATTRQTLKPGNSIH